MRVSVSETGRFDGPESGALWGLDPNTDVLVRPPATSMQLKDFFELTKSSNDSANSASGEGAVKETFYLEYLALTQYLGKARDSVFCFIFMNIFLMFLFLSYSYSYIYSHPHPHPDSDLNPCSNPTFSSHLLTLPSHPTLSRHHLSPF